MMDDFMRSWRFFLGGVFLLSLCQCVDPVPDERKEICQSPGDEDGNGLVNIDDPACATKQSITLREDCSVTEDRDGDGFSGCDDSECAMLEVCTIEQCDRPGDEDGDGAFNCDDSECDPMQCLAENCSNQIDDDGDGKTDCEDSECLMAMACIPEDCVAPGDEDGDGKRNCEDEDCRAEGGFPSCSEREGARCSASEPFVCQGGEDVGFMGGLHACNDNNDNDWDGFTDCNDADCRDSCYCIQCTELCNGIDDDMDRVIDEGCPCVSKPMLGVCAESTLNFLGECSFPDSYHPSVDKCGDNLDNDCNGSVDDGCPCIYQGIDAGVCRNGIIQSNGTCAQPVGYYDVESGNLCNDNIDNDCDGQIDAADSQCM